MNENQSTAATTPAAEFVWANAWGGATKSTSPPMIHAKALALRREIGGLKAEKVSGGPNFPVKSAKTLETKLQPALDKLGLVMPATYEVTTIDPIAVPITKNSRGDVVVRSACTIKCTLRLIAEDGSFIESQGCGGGLDGDDKAVGKASTYSRKDAFMKMLAVPDQSMIDTDDDSEVGTPVADPQQKPGTVPAQPSLRVVSEPVSDSSDADAQEGVIAAEITMAGSSRELRAIGMKARKLPMDAQLRLSARFMKKQAELEPTPAGA